MDTYRIVAESMVHRGRRLLVNERGEGFLQISRDARPLPVAADDFKRLRAMRHYRPVPERLWAIRKMVEPVSVAV